MMIASGTSTRSWRGTSRSSARHSRSWIKQCSSCSNMSSMSTSIQQLELRRSKTSSSSEISELVLHAGTATLAALRVLQLNHGVELACTACLHFISALHIALMCMRVNSCASLDLLAPLVSGG